MSSFVAKLPVFLSIAGSDNTGGAGIQADIKTACKLKVYSATVVTAVTAQSHHGMACSEYVGAKVLKSQIITFMQGYRPDAVKIGLLPNEESVSIVADAIREYKWKNIVLDPLLKPTAGGFLMTDDEKTADAMVKELFGLCTLITPNIPEYEYFTVKYGLDVFKSAKAMLLKGGHGDEADCVDRLHIFGDKPLEFVYPSNRIMTRHTHGSGCVLSSAIACGLAKGETLQTSVGLAKRLVNEAMRKGEEYPVSENYGPLCLI